MFVEHYFPLVTRHIEEATDALKQNLRQTPFASASKRNSENFKGFSLCSTARWTS
jgi:hypothetical protein